MKNQPKTIQQPEKDLKTSKLWQALSDAESEMIKAGDDPPNERVPIPHIAP